MNAIKSTEAILYHKASIHSKRESLVRTKEEIKFFDEDNNYIDYFIEIGVKPEIFKEDFLYNSVLDDINKKLNPQIISKFPETNKKSIIINNKILSQIFPNGFKAIEAKNKPDKTFFAIMSDNQLYSITYKYKYLACLIIYESINDYRILYNIYFNKENNENPDNNIYIPKCLCIASVNPCIDKFEIILNTIYEDTLSNKYNNLFVNQLIEELVIRTPKIPQGYKRVLLKINDKIIDLTEKRINDYPLIHVDLTKIFALFNTTTLLDIFKYILFEGNLIFFSSKIYDLTNSIMSFLFLLSPFKYQYQVISVLPKEFYSYLESDIPYIFGINKRYEENFFVDNDIYLEKKVICIVDLDEKKYEFIPKAYNVKENPVFPKHFRNSIDNKIQEYYKLLINSTGNSLDMKEVKKVNKKKEKEKMDDNNKNVIEDKNEQYQLIFYKFMVELLEDYSKYIKKDVNTDNINNLDINEMIDINSYLNTFNVGDKEFYKKIFKTKMFKEFIRKRIEPRNNTEKIEIIFFEEKINERIIEKKMFGKSKIREQNKLLSSQDYEYSSDPEIIDLSKQVLPQEVMDLFKDSQFIKENCLNNGYIIEERKEENKSIFTFSYYIFPSLLDSNFFLLNASYYTSAPLLYKHIDLLNSKIVKKTTIKFYKKPFTKKYNLENDLYICYIILWSLTFWYTDDREKEYRFKKMVKILDKIIFQKQEIYQILLVNLKKWGAEEEQIFYIYIRFLSQKLNTNWTIFNIVFPILEKKENDIKINPTAQYLKLGKINLKTPITKLSLCKQPFIKRTLKSRNEWEDYILSDDISYKCYNKCIGCGKVIDIGKLCSKLSLMHTKNRNGIDMVRCTHKTKDGNICDYYNFLRLKFRYGTELFNPKLSKISTCKNINMPLLSTSTLKEKLNDINKLYKDSEEKIDIDLFKREHQLEFWNSIWYFKLNEIDISFILPYCKPEKENLNELLSNLNNLNYNKKVENHKVNIINDNKNIEIERSNFKTKYFHNELCEQTLFQFSFIKKVGMISYKNIYMYEDNINYNELPLRFENTTYEQDYELQNEPTLVRCLTSNFFNNNNDESYSQINTSYATNTPVTKKYTSYISFLKQNEKKENQTLANSSSSPMLVNNNNASNISSTRILNAY